MLLISKGNSNFNICKASLKRKHFRTQNIFDLAILKIEFYVILMIFVIAFYL